MSFLSRPGLVPRRRKKRNKNTSFLPFITNPTGRPAEELAKVSNRAQSKMLSQESFSKPSASSAKEARQQKVHRGSSGRILLSVKNLYTDFIVACSKRIFWLFKSTRQSFNIFKFTLGKSRCTKNLDSNIPYMKIVEIIKLQQFQQKWNSPLT